MYSDLGDALKNQEISCYWHHFIVKYVRFFSKPSPDLIRNQNSLPIVIMPLASKKSNLNYDSSLSSKQLHVICLSGEITLRDIKVSDTIMAWGFNTYQFFISHTLSSFVA